jgi:hypothetical protein
LRKGTFHSAIASEDVSPKGPLEFAAHSAAEYSGQRIENKICELCGVNFFRDSSKSMRERDRECKRCAVKLATPKDPIPPANGAEEAYAKKYAARREKRAAAGLKFGPKTEEARRRCGNFTRGAERKGGGTRISRAMRDAAVRAAMRQQTSVVQ